MMKNSRKLDSKARRGTSARTAALFCALFVAGAHAQDAVGAAKDRKLTDLDLEQLVNLKVTSASLHDQSLEDAPASITVITAEEIRKFGYRTLADALSYVRGFFFTADHSYTYLGVRGFALPGDYDTRVIVMINGHNIADNVFDMSTWFGNDFPLDIGLVDRIEVVRGASSALYGSNGMLATINVITKKPADATVTTVRVETSSAGERKIAASTALSLPRNAHLLFATSVFNNKGAHQIYFSELDAPETNFGRAIGVDGEKGYHAFADLTWGNWEVLALAGDRVKQQPVSWGDTVFGDRGTSIEDSRGFLDITYNKDLPGDRSFVWRAYYDAYRCRGTYHYPTAGAAEDNREHDYGDWVGSKFSYRFPDLAHGHLTLGGELRVDLRSLQNVFDANLDHYVFLRVNRSDRNAAIFAQQEWAFGRHWELNVGARYDWSWLRKSALSPRIGVIYKPLPRTDVKLLYSRGFRNPSSYDMFYDDNGLTQIPNPSLRPETVDSFEFDFDRQFTSRLKMAAAVYHYSVNDLIQQIYTPEGLDLFVNQDHVSAAGASLELTYRFPAGIDVSTSLEVQRAVFGIIGSVLPNSPGQVGKLRLSKQFWRDRLTVSAGLQALGERRTYQGATVPPLILPEAVISTRPFRGGLAFSAGIKNLSNSFYRDPAGLTPTVDSMIGAGRTCYVRLNWRSRDEMRP